MSDKTELLLPCPFCGNPKPELVGVTSGANHYRVGCSKCGSYNNISNSRERALNTWNHRPDSALRVALEEIFSQCCWTASVHHSWEEGRGARKHTNSSTVSVNGEFKTEEEAMAAARGAIAKRNIRSTTHSINFDRARPYAHFRIPHKLIDEIGRAIARTALAQPAPQYSESALDRFAEAGKEAWANAPESAKLIRQVEVGENPFTDDDTARNGTTRTTSNSLEFGGIKNVDCPFCGAVAGESCHGPSGGKCRSHAERIDAARSRGEGK